MIDMEPEDLNLQGLVKSAEAAPGVRELITLYSYYWSLEVATEPMRRTMRARSISSVSNGAYPALPQ